MNKYLEKVAGLVGTIKSEASSMLGHSDTHGLKYFAAGLSGKKAKTALSNLKNKAPEEFASYKAQKRVTNGYRAMVAGGVGAAGAGVYAAKKKKD